MICVEHGQKPQNEIGMVTLVEVFLFKHQLHYRDKEYIITDLSEPPHQKTNILHMRKQRCRSALK